jgi:phosphoribosyl-ATP pyrophosphohydrolase
MAKAPKTKSDRKAIKIPVSSGKKRAAIINTTDVGVEVEFDPEKQLKRARSRKARALSQAAIVYAADPHILNRLWSIIELRLGANLALNPSKPPDGVGNVAQRFGESAVECLIEAVACKRIGTIGKSADVLYHLMALWLEAGIRPEEVWLELEKREGASALVDGPKGPQRRLRKSIQLGTSKIP